MPEQQSNGKDYDPVSAFREMRDNYLDAWAKAMMESVNTDSYAKATGKMLDTYLTVSTPFREALEKTMLQALQQLSMPSREDFISLAERATHIEMKLDDLDARLDNIQKQLGGSPARRATRAQSRKPQRSRKSRKGAK
jgi:hypothetical protein